MIRSPRRFVRLAFVTLACVALAVVAAGCGGGDDGPTTPPPAGARTVKYEITGNYTGALTIAYTTESSATVSAEVSALPWSKSVTFPRGAFGVGIAGGSTVGRGGVAGQTVTVRIYAGDSVVQSEVATAAASGLLSLPSLAYVLQ